MEILIKVLLQECRTFGSRYQQTEEIKGANWKDSYG